MEGKKWTAISVIAEEKHKKSGFKMIRICASKITGTRSWFQYYLVSSIGLPLSPPPPSVIKKYYLLTVSLFLSWQQMTMKKTTNKRIMSTGEENEDNEFGNEKLNHQILFCFTACWGPS